VLEQEDQIDSCQLILAKIADLLKTITS